MSVGSRLLDEREIIWKRRAIILNDFVRKHISWFFAGTVLSVIFLLNPFIKEILQESLSAYLYLYNSSKEVLVRYTMGNNIKIVLSGGNQISADELNLSIKNAFAEHGGSLNKVKEDLLKSPLIKSVLIRRNLSLQKITIHITERKWTGAIVRPENVLIGIDSEGNILDISQYGNILKDLVLVQNVIDPATFVNLYNYLKYIGIHDQIKEARLISGRRWNIKMKNDLLIKLPEFNWHNALRVFVNMNKKMGLLQDDNKILYVDLRIKNKIFIR